MKLWLLRPIENLPEDNNPWEPWYDKVFGFVIRAETENEARKIAQENGGDELIKWTWDKTPQGQFSMRSWLDSNLSSCMELKADGEPGLIIKDFAAA
jgi:hypothetical protein